MSWSAFSRLLSLHTWVQTILHPPPSGPCRQWKRALSAFIFVSTDSAGVAGIYGLQLRSAVMETWLWGEGGSWTCLLLLLFQHRDVVCWSQGRWCRVIVCRMPLFKQFYPHCSLSKLELNLPPPFHHLQVKPWKDGSPESWAGPPKPAYFHYVFCGGKIDFDKQNKISLFFVQPVQVPSCREELLSVMSCRFWFL